AAVSETVGASALAGDGTAGTSLNEGLARSTCDVIASRAVLPLARLPLRSPGALDASPSAVPVVAGTSVGSFVVGPADRGRSAANFGRGKSSLPRPCDSK